MGRRHQVRLRLDEDQYQFIEAKARDQGLGINEAVLSCVDDCRIEDVGDSRLYGQALRMNRLLQRIKAEVEYSRTEGTRHHIEFADPDFDIDEAIEKVKVFQRAALGMDNPYMTHVEEDDDDLDEVRADLEQQLEI